MCIPNDRSGSSELFFANFSSTPLAIRTPKAGGHHVLDVAIFTVSQFHFDLRGARTGKRRRVEVHGRLR